MGDPTIDPSVFFRPLVARGTWPVPPAPERARHLTEPWVPSGYVKIAVENHHFDGKNPPDGHVQ